MKHLSMAEWDQKVAPLLGAMEIRCGWVWRDILQIKEWVDQLPYAPGFETEAFYKLQKINGELMELVEAITHITKQYDSKEKVT